MEDLSEAGALGSSAAAALLREEILRAVGEKTREEKPYHYAVLNVSRNATLEEVKKAYRREALKWHPDKNDAPEAAARFLDVQEAWNVLRYAKLRQQYDAGKDVDLDAKSDFDFTVMSVNRTTGKARVKFTDKQTGEEEFADVDIDVEPEHSTARVRLPDHYCLPG